MLRIVLMTIVCCAIAAGADKRRPNILLLYADDAGYADFGFHGSRSFKTPVLDALAEDGVLLTQFYMTAAVCGPSRAGMMTGRYQQRFGFEENNVPGYMSAHGETGDEMGLPLGLPTMGSLLRDAGYRTGYIGKWHLGHADCFHPTHRGFETFYGFRGGARSFYSYEPDAMPEVERWMERGLGAYEEPTSYLTDALADEACRFIREETAEPFFLFVSFNAVHTPMQADPADRAMFPELDGKRRTLAQMTFSMDRAIGKIIDALESAGIREETLVVFTNDNGGPTDASTASNWPLSGCKATHLEGGIRVPCILSWPGVLEAGSRYVWPVSALDFLPTFLRVAEQDPESVEGLDGVDLLPYLMGDNRSRPHEALFWKKENRGAVRVGDWKLLRFPDRPAELYRLDVDPAERNDVAAVYPEQVRTLYTRLFNWECEMVRPRFMLKRLYEERAAERMDRFRKQYP